MGIWSAQIEQTELVKGLQLKVNNYEDEFNAMNKRINEMKALATLGSGMTSLRPNLNLNESQNG